MKPITSSLALRLGRGLLSASSLVALALIAPTSDAQRGIRPANGVELAPRWKPLDGPQGGRTLSLAIKPTAPDEVFAGHYFNGLWRSNDSGARWSLASPTSGTLSPADIVFHPTDPLIGYIAGSGVHRTTDGGHTWIQANAPANVSGMSDVAIDQTDPSWVFAIQNNLLFQNGVFRSSDGGQTWEELLLPPTHSFSRADDIVVTSTGALLLATYWIAPNRGIARSLDHGDSFGLVAQGGYFVGLSVCNTNPPTVWSNKSDAVFRSTNDGQSFTQVSGNPVTGGWINVISAHPTSPAIALIGSSKGVYRTSNGGGSWQAATGLPPSANIQDFEFDPRDPSVVLAAESDAHGVWRSTDGGATWSPWAKGMNDNALDVVFDPNPTGRVYFTGSQAPHRVTLATRAWQTFALDTTLTYWSADVAVDPGNPSRVWWIDRSYGEIFRSDDDCETWISVLHPTLFGKPWAMDLDPSGNPLIGSWLSSEVLLGSNGGQSFSPSSLALGSLCSDIAVDSVAPARIHAADEVGYNRSSNGGASFVQVTSGLTTGDFRSVEVAPWNHDEVFLGSADGRLFRSTNSGTTWAQVGDGLPGAALRGLALDASMPGRVLIVAEAAGVWRSDDFGAHFRAFDAGLPSSSVLDVAIDPNGTGKAVVLLRWYGAFYVLLS